MASHKHATDLTDLQKTIDTTQSLITQFQSALRTGKPAGKTQSLSSSPQPLHLLSTAASLLRAQITKVSLLLLNKPFTPTAISHVISTLANSILPSLMTAWELSHHPCIPRIVSKHIKVVLSSVLNEVKILLASIPINEYGVEEVTGSRDTLANTGVLWNACDKLIQIGENGVEQLAVSLAKQDLELFQDAMRELQEWSPGEDDGLSSCSSDLDENSSQIRHDDLSAEEDMKVDVTAFLEEVNVLAGRLPCVLQDFPLLNKKTSFDTTQHDGPTSDQCDLLDTILMVVHLLTEDTDELIGALYSNDTENMKNRRMKMSNTRDDLRLLGTNIWEETGQYREWSERALRGHT